MKKTEDKQEAMLYKMLRERQARQNIVYMTTDHTVYKFCKVMFRLLLILCTALNLIFLLGQWGGLQANLSYAEALSDLQQEEVAAIKSGIYSVGALSVLLLLSEVFLDLKKPLMHMVSTLLSGILLLVTYASRLSDALSSGSYSSFIWKHAVPLGLLMLFSLLVGGIHLRQKLKDKKGMDEISEEIYKRYSVLAEAISPEQWETLLAEYHPAEPKSKKRSVKARLRKEQAKQAVTVAQSDTTEKEEV